MWCAGGLPYPDNSTSDSEVPTHFYPGFPLPEARPAPPSVGAALLPA